MSTAIPKKFERPRMDSLTAGVIGAVIGSALSNALFGSGKELHGGLFGAATGAALAPKLSVQAAFRLESPKLIRQYKSSVDVSGVRFLDAHHAFAIASEGDRYFSLESIVPANEAHSRDELDDIHFNNLMDRLEQLLNGQL